MVSEPKLLNGTNSSVYHEGWLRKECRKSKVLGVALPPRLKHRYFELQDGQLRYWHEKPDVSALRPQKHPAVLIDLVKTCVVELPNRGISITGVRLPRPYVLRAATLKDHTRWLAALTAACAEHAVEPADFAVEQLVGTGSFGSVYRVRCKATGQVFAMKVIEKQRVTGLADLRGVMEEKQLLQALDHPFIVHLHCTFQTDDKLFMIMDYLPGGECFYHITQRHFNEQTARLAACQILLALDYLHEQKIIYRDLKPENCVLDAEGNVVLTDFGLSCRTSNGRRRSRVGSPDYWAPEVLLREEYTKAVDYWALGCLLFEMVTGRHPFAEAQGAVPHHAAVEKQPRLDDAAISPECKSFIAALLEKDPTRRLQSLQTASKHRWLAGTDWDKVLRRQVRPPFVPSPDDSENFDPSFVTSSVALKPSACGFPVRDFAWSAPGLAAGLRSLSPPPTARARKSMGDKKTSFGSSVFGSSSSSSSSGTSN